MEYRILSVTRKLDDSREDAILNMEILVQSYLNVGWEALGGLCVSKDTFYQAIVYKGNDNTTATTE